MKSRQGVSVLLLALIGITAVMAARGAQAQVQANDTPVRPVGDLEVSRYMGQWYELGRYPNRFQKKCTGAVVVDYALRPDGRIDVRNRCDTAKGTIEAVGVARRADPEGPASVLEVRFAPAFLSFLPVWGDYWVLDLDREYSTAVVGTPGRDYLWILSRTPHVDAPTYARLLEAARSQGFDVDRIVRTPQ
jgi:apolipoprotein D and lipocalin family protein